jgi:hypothetical protein
MTSVCGLRPATLRPAPPACSRPLRCTRPLLAWRRVKRTSARLAGAGMRSTHPQLLARAHCPGKNPPITYNAREARPVSRSIRSKTRDAYACPLQVFQPPAWHGARVRCWVFWLCGAACRCFRCAALPTATAVPGATKQGEPINRMQAEWHM